MRLTLIRHGQTSSNVTGLLDTGVPGAPLTDLGRRQAAAVPAALAGQPVDAVFASTLLRTQQTAEPLAQARGLQVAVAPGLREVAAGDLEMASDADSVHRYIGTLFRWLRGEVSTRIPGAESGVEVLDRFDAAVDVIYRKVGDRGAAVAVSHGAVIRIWAAIRGGEPDAGEHHLDNTGAVVLDRAVDGTWAISSWQQQALGGAVLDNPETAGPAR